MRLKKRSKVTTLKKEAHGNMGYPRFRESVKSWEIEFFKLVSNLYNCSTSENFAEPYFWF